MNRQQRRDAVKPAPKQAPSVKTSQSYKDSSAILDNILFGTALPDHLARVKAPSHTHGDNPKIDQEAAEARRFNAALNEKVAAKFTKAPLVAVNYKHTCRCGSSWATFGFFARRTETTVHNEAVATFTKRLDYNPLPIEKPTEVIWNDVNEETCLSCYMGVEGVKYDSLNPLASGEMPL